MLVELTLCNLWWLMGRTCGMPVGLQTLRGLPSRASWISLAMRGQRQALDPYYSQRSNLLYISITIAFVETVSGRPKTKRR
jgi:hypothetical protein